MMIAAPSVAIRGAVLLSRPELEAAPRRGPCDVAAERLNGARPRQARAVTDRRSFMEGSLSAPSVRGAVVVRASFAAAGPFEKMRAGARLADAIGRQGA